MNAVQWSDTERERERERRSLNILSVKKEAIKAVWESTGWSEGRIYDVEDYLQFVRDVGDYQKMKGLSWNNIAFWTQELW